MKKIICYAVAGGLLTLGSGCTNLDVDVNSKYTTYPNSPIALEAMEADVFYAFRNALGVNYNVAQSLSSDEEVGISFDGDYYDKAAFAHPTLHNFLPDDGCLSYYSDLGSGITKCNTLIETYGDQTTSAAQARAMRAFYHFILMDSFGDTPIIDKLAEGGTSLDRSPRAEVAKWIEKELLEIIPSLPSTVDETTYGKPTRWMAEALLVKLYLNWAVYTAKDVTAYEPSDANEKLNDCVKYCDDIIKSGHFNLSDPYRSKFFPDNGYQIKDFIYAIPYDCVTEKGMHYERYRTWRKTDGGGDDGSTTYYGDKGVKSFGGNISLTPEFASLFSLKGDDRNGVILRDTIYQYDAITREKTGKVWTYKGKPVVLQKNITLKANKDGIVENPEFLNTGATVTGWSQGYKSMKFWVCTSDYKNDRNQSNDVPIFRYADIILEKAEAILRGAKATNGQTPMSLMNEIRSYVHASLLTTAPTLQDILDERGREFITENWRRNDLIRFGKFEDEWGFHKKGFNTARFDKTCRIFPIPTSVLNLNTNWEQNPGY